MAYDMSGTLGKNQYQKNDSQPAYTGDCIIGGVEYRIAAWVKHGENGRFFGLKFTLRDAPKKEVSSSEVTPIEIDEDIPF